MNRIYKVIWNSTRECYVVASELAKGAGKAARNKKGIVAGLTLAVLLSIGGGYRRSLCCGRPALFER